MAYSQAEHDVRPTSPPIWTGDKRPTIGFITHNISDDYGSSLWHGMLEAAERADVNLMCFDGRNLGSPQGFEAQSNVLYVLAGAENVDGLVIGGGPMSSFAGLAGLQVLCDSFRPLPVITIAVGPEGVPCVSIDNHSGMYDMVVHLIQVHACRRVAFVRGPDRNPEAEIRYQAYCDALAAQAIALDPSLVSPPGPFDKPGGIQAISVLLDERGLWPGQDFTAVVATTDDVADGVMDALRARGFQVPEDVAVVGFNDQEMAAKSIVPPLTTVRQPMRELTRQATEFVLAQLRGEPVPARLTLPTQLVVRQSCGCQSQAVAQAAAGPDAAQVVDDVLHALSPTGADSTLSPEMVRAWVAPLLTRFAGEMDGGSPGEFLQALQGVLRQAAASGSSLDAWQNVLSALRRHCMLSLEDGEKRLRAENIWNQARVLVGEAAQQVQAARALRAKRQTQTLNEIASALITVDEPQEVMDVLVGNLPHLDIPTCYIALYEDPQPSTYTYPQPPPEFAWLMLAYDETGKIELGPDEWRFPCRQLVPKRILPPRRFSFLVEPLYFRQRQIGFVLFESKVWEGELYRVLRAQLSGAWHGALAFQARQRAEAELEKAYAEVKRRASQLQIAADVSRAVSSILDLEQLLQQVVTLTAASYQLYGAFIFLLGGTPPTLSRAAAAASELLLEHESVQDISLEAEDSLVAQAARSHQPVVVNDLARAAYEEMISTPPQTRSELAIPMLLGHKLLGVFDLQSDQPYHFGEDDARVLRTLAEQVAVAVRNAQLFSEARAARTSAEIANRAKSEFLASMSHELRTPLNGILGYAQILLRDRQLDESYRAGVDIIRQSGEHLLMLINDILDLAKIEARKLELYPADFALLDFLQGVAGIIRARAKQKHVAFLFEPDAHLPGGVRADEKRLRQVLLNLLGNAVKFTQAGQVLFRVRATSPSSLSEVSVCSEISICFEVQDTGIGMEAEQLRRLFRPFEQVGELSTRIEGTGLGLAISQQLVQAMGGQIKVESVPGQGSTFWFELDLPVTAAPGQVARAPDIVGYKGARKKALVVDDRPHNRAVLSHMLAALGFEVSEAEGGRQAVEQVRQARPDIVFMDLVMPEVSGFEATQQIRQLPGLDAGQLVIVGTSASVLDQDKQRSIVAGCDGFLAKPIEMGKLLKQLQVHLHLEWVYAGTAEEGPLVGPDEEQALIPPPLEELKALHELVKGGDMWGIEERAGQLEERDPQWGLFAQALRRLAKGFEDEQIMALLERFMP